MSWSLIDGRLRFTSLFLSLIITEGGIIIKIIIDAVVLIDCYLCTCDHKKLHGI